MKNETEQSSKLSRYTLWIETIVAWIRVQVPSNELKPGVTLITQFSVS